MGKIGVSLCILAHNRIAETANLIGSLHGFSGIELEVCIADQESDQQSRIFAEQTADKFTEISDHQLWHKGFGFAKQKVVNLASNNWVIIGDPGEIWHDTTAHGSCHKLSRAIRTHNSVPAFRTYYGRPKSVHAILDGKATVRALSGDLGRIFDKRKMAIRGWIHEAPLHKETGKLWAEWARRHKGVGLIEHDPRPVDPVYAKRKKLLYDHLLYEIVQDPKKRHGTDFKWWTAHWQSVVAPRYKNISFEDWKAIGG
jgi:hypothetical protein